MTLAVNDIALLATHLQHMAHGALSATPQLRTIMLNDPDGRHIPFAQALGGTMAR